MNLIIAGTNHKCSPIELRERLYFSKKKVKDALKFLKERKVLKGAVILSTCNRVEIYANTKDLRKGVEEIENFISRFHKINKQKFHPYFYIYEGRETVKHLFSVACGLDSQILGETQILGQIKFSLEEACKADFADKFLMEVFSQAISFARRMHNQIKISDGKVSIGSVAINFIKEKIGALSDKNILIIGIGKVTELVLSYLKEEKLNIVFISNRTFEKAKYFADKIGASAVRFDNLARFISQADIVISATASPHFVLREESLKQAKNRRLLLIDLSVPRDIDPEVKKIKGVDLYSIEDLDSVIKKSIKSKEKKAEKIRELINIKVEKLWK